MGALTRREDTTALLKTPQNQLDLSDHNHEQLRNQLMTFASFYFDLTFRRVRAGRGDIL